MRQQKGYVYAAALGAALLATASASVSFAQEADDDDQTEETPAASPAAAPAAAPTPVQQAPILAPMPAVVPAPTRLPAPITYSTPQPAVVSTAWSTHSPAEGTRNETRDTLLGTGLFLLAVSYLPAVSVAASSNMVADQHLYAPIAGPWLDLAQRKVCSPPVNCEAEQTNRALLETSGILQGVGAFLTLVGLLTTDDDDAHHPAKPMNDAKATVHVTPTQFGSAGYGMAAFGKF